MNEPMNALLTIAEFAKARDVTPRTVNNWLAQSRLAGARKVAGKWAIPADAVLGPPAGADVVAVTDAAPPVAAAPSYPAPVPFRPKGRPFPLADVAAEWGQSPDTIRRWARDGVGGMHLLTGAHGAHFVWIEAAG